MIFLVCSSELRSEGSVFPVYLMLFCFCFNTGAAKTAKPPIFCFWSKEKQRNIFKCQCWVDAESWVTSWFPVFPSLDCFPITPLLCQNENADIFFDLLFPQTLLYFCVIFGRNVSLIWTKEFATAEFCRETKQVYDWDEQFSWSGD